MTGAMPLRQCQLLLNVLLCGTAFPVLERRPDVTKYSTNSDDNADPLYTPVSRSAAMVDVYDVTYKRHAKPGKPPTLWVNYLTSSKNTPNGSASSTRDLPG